MLNGLAALLAFQLAGEVIAFETAYAIPGPVIGLILLVLYLGTKKRWAPASSLLPERCIETAADGLLANIGLLFVPAGVGVLQHTDLLAHYGVKLFLVLLLSTLITLGVTVLVFLAVKKLSAGKITPVADTCSNDEGPLP